MDRIPDLPHEYTTDDVARLLTSVQGLLSGYSGHGAPVYLNQFDGRTTTGAVGARPSLTVSTTESTVGLSTELFAGNGSLGLRVQNSGLTSALGLTLDGAIYGKSTLRIDGNTGLGQAPGTNPLEVTGTSKFSSRVGIGGAPDGTIMLKVTGSQWVTTTSRLDGNVGVGQAAGTLALEVTGAASVSQSLTVDSTTLKVNHSTHRVGVLTTSPGADFEVSGGAFVTGNVSTPTTGVGVHVYYGPFSASWIKAYNYGTSAYNDLNIVGNRLTLAPGGTIKVECDTTGVAFFAGSPAAKQTVTGSRAANAALASLLTALAAYGLVTDSSTV